MPQKNLKQWRDGSKISFNFESNLWLSNGPWLHVTCNYNKMKIS